MAKKKNYTERAIEYAIAGGWPYENMGPDFFQKKHMIEWRKFTIYHPQPKLFFLDPLFWKGLAVGLQASESEHRWIKRNKHGIEISILDWWSNMMHSFIDHLLEGKVAESFFEDLLTHYAK